MNHNDEQLDHYLRQTLEGKTFEQKPHYWEGARKLIDTHRKQRNRHVLLYSVSAALVAVVATAWMYMSAPERNVAFATVNPQPANSNTTEQVVPAPKPSTQPQAAVLATDVPAGALANRSASNASPSLAVAAVSSHTRKPKRLPNNAIPAGATPASAEQLKLLTTQEPENISSRKLSRLPGYHQAIPTDTFNRKQFVQSYTQHKQQRLWLVEAGVNSYNGLSANLHGGIRYMHFVNPTWAFSVGAGYAQLHQNLNRVYQDIDYSFGQQVQETTISTTRVDYIELPVAVHYSLNTRNLITLGCIPAYAISTHNQTTYSLGETPSTHQTTYPDAVNRFDLQLQAGYSFRFNDIWMLSAGYQFGLMDVSNNNVFKTTNFDRNKGLRLTLGYKLF